MKVPPLHLDRLLVLVLEEESILALAPMSLRTGIHSATFAHTDLVAVGEDSADTATLLAGSPQAQMLQGGVAVEGLCQELRWVEDDRSWTFSIGFPPPSRYPLPPGFESMQGEQTTKLVDENWSFRVARNHVSYFRKYATLGVSRLEVYVSFVRSMSSTTVLRRALESVEAICQENLPSTKQRGLWSASPYTSSIRHASIVSDLAPLRAPSLDTT